jgi:signal peptidase II
MLFWGGAFSVFILDQLTKFIVHRGLAPLQSLPLIKNILHLTYVQNRGAAFGFLYGQQVFLVSVALMVSALIYYYHLQLKPGNWLQVPLGFILGGSVSNVLDRIFRHYVVDFIDFRVWPVFNIADVMINIGVGWLIFMILFPHPPRLRRGPPSPS